MTEPVDTSTESVKAAVNLALDNVESAGFEVTEIGLQGPLTQRLSRILDDLEQWKADLWEALDD